MKPQGLLFIIVFTLFVWSCRSLFGCPTCVGRPGEHGPAFFDQNFYKPHQKPPTQPKYEIMQHALRKAAPKQKATK